MEVHFNTILNFIKSTARNKLIIHKEKLPGIVSINLGFVFSKEIKSIPPQKHFGLIAKEKLNNLLYGHIHRHEILGEYLAIENIGILFEPQLKIDLLSFLEYHSKNTSLFLMWPGDIEGDQLYFLTRQNGIEINLKNISHLKYEV